MMRLRPSLPESAEDAHRLGKPVRVSLAIPIYNEESVVPELLRRTTAVLDSLPGGPHQIVFADDGSTDRTLALLEEAAAADPRLVVVALSRNFGHQAALTAALDQASGDVVVAMDGDLQDAPELIPLFLDQYYQGFDVVYAVRAQRQEGWLLRSSYALFYRLIAALADISLPLGAGDFALMSRRVVGHLRRVPERHRYLRGLRTWVGFKQTALPVNRDARHSGKSKYSLGKLMQLACDGIFAFSMVPLRAATVVGFLCLAGSLVYALGAVFAKVFLDLPPQGFTALVLFLTFFAGVQLFFLGIIGEYIGRIYQEVKQRPHYIVAKVVAQGKKRKAKNGQAWSSHTLEKPKIPA